MNISSSPRNNSISLKSYTERNLIMKKMFAMLTCLGLCGVMLAGCSRNDDNSGSTSSGVTATTTSKNEVTSRRDDSDTLVSRVGDGIKDTVSGGADIIDDTVSTVESVVDDIIR